LPAGPPRKYIIYMFTIYTSPFPPHHFYTLITIGRWYTRSRIKRVHHFTARYIRTIIHTHTRHYYCCRVEQVPSKRKRATCCLRRITFVSSSSYTTRAHTRTDGTVWSVRSVWTVVFFFFLLPNRVFSRSGRAILRRVHKRVRHRSVDKIDFRILRSNRPFRNFITLYAHAAKRVTYNDVLRNGRRLKNDRDLAVVASGFF